MKCLMRSFLWIVILVFSLGCSTQVSSIKNDQVTSLSADEGYLFLVVDNSNNLYEMHIKGVKNIILTDADLRRNSNYILLKLPEGKYEISEIKLNTYYSVNLKERDKYWSFNIYKNSISYAGHLITKRNYNFYNPGLSLEIENQSSVAMEYLELNFPVLLESTQVNYSGPGEDDFFKFIQDHEKLNKGDSRE